MAQLVKRPTLDFGSGHDLTVLGLSPGAELGALLKFHFLPLPLSPAHTLSLLKKITFIFIFVFIIYIYISETGDTGRS